MASPSPKFDPERLAAVVREIRGLANEIPETCYGLADEIHSNLDDLELELGLGEIE